MIFRPDFSNVDIGIIYGIISSALYAGLFVLIRTMDGIDVLTRSFYFVFFSGLFLFPFRENWSFDFSGKTWLFISLMGAFNVVSIYLINMGARSVQANNAGIITTSGVFFGIAISYIVFKETFTWIEMIGALLIVLSIILLNVRLPKRLGGGKGVSKS